MAARLNSNPNNNEVLSLLLPEIGPDGLARESPVIAYTEKVIAEEQLQLRKYIEENLSKIHDIERELANLNMEMKLTSGPKKAALEHMRKKIEMATERIRLAKMKEEEAKKAWKLGAKAVHDEEAIKQKLCEDLNSLIQESSKTQLTRLEELKRRMVALNLGRSSTYVASDGNQRPALASMTQDSNAVLSTSEPSSATIGTVSHEAIAGNTPGNGQNQQPSGDGKGRGKKKNIMQGRVKGRGSAGSGWTGAGFDVDGRG